MAISPVLARVRGSVKRLVLVSLLIVAACKPEPQPASAYEGEPVRILDAAELGEAGKVEGFGVVVVREGEGPQAEQGDFVRCHYIVLLGSKEFDSSHDGDPLLFRLGNDDAVIEGMHVGVEGMRVGELRRIAVPPKLGYRNRTGTGVPPDTSLTFLIELVEVKPAG